MTWGKFKQIIEALEVRDEDEIDWIEVNPCAPPIRVTISEAENVRISRCEELI